jgi:hypothetical protein
LNRSGNTLAAYGFTRARDRARTVESGGWDAH